MSLSNIEYGSSEDDLRELLVMTGTKVDLKPGLLIFGFLVLVLPLSLGDIWF